MSDAFTKWDDTGSVYTSWDGPAGDPTETRWDVLPAELKIDQIAVVRAARWVASTQPAKWLAKVIRQ